MSMDSSQTVPPPTWHTFAWKVFLAALIITGVVLLVIAVREFGRVFLLLFAGILFAVFLRGLADDLSEHTGMGSGVSLAIVVCGLIGLATALGFFMAPQIGGQLAELRVSLPAALTRIQEWAQDLPVIGGLMSESGNSQQSGAELLRSRIPAMFTSTLNGLVAGAFVFIVGIYLAVRPRAYVHGMLKLLPVDYRPRASQVFSAIGHTLQRWLIGQLMIMAFVGTLTTIGLALVGVPLALTLGIIAGLLDFIPNIGPFIAAVPGILIAFLGGPEQAFYAGLVYVAVQQLEGYALTPLIHKRMVRLEPALTISAQLAFGLTMGVLGILLATPLVAALMVAVQMLYIEDMLGDTVETEGSGHGEEQLIADRH